MFIIETVIVSGFDQPVSFTDFPAVGANNVVFDFPQRISVFDFKNNPIHPKENQTTQ
jgi:hypothetical protein